MFAREVPDALREIEEREVGLPENEREMSDAESDTACDETQRGQRILQPSLRLVMAQSSAM